MQSDILVLGALGNVGSEVIKSLQAKNVRVRAGDLFPDRIIQRFGEKAQAVLFDFADPDSFNAAFKGVKKMFVMRPPQISNVRKYMLPALEAAKAAGVTHMVFLSLIGIEQNKVVPHYQVEQWLRRSGLDFTFLRCSFFMQNLNTTHLAEIRDLNEIYIPVGSAKTSFLDVRDIGAVAAEVLTHSGHEKVAYDLTGAEALDYYQVAEIFTRILERKIVYKDPDPLHFFIRQLQKRSDLVFALVTTWLYSNTKRGMADQITGDVRKILGRDPIRMPQYVADYKSIWMK